MELDRRGAERDRDGSAEDRADLIAVLRQTIGRRLAAAGHWQEGALDRLESEGDRSGAGKDREQAVDERRWCGRRRRFGPATPRPGRPTGCEAQQQDQRPYPVDRRRCDHYPPGRW